MCDGIRRTQMQERPFCLNLLAAQSVTSGVVRIVAVRADRCALRYKDEMRVSARSATRIVVFAALLDGPRAVLPPGVAKVEGGAEQRDMRECLWEVANLPPERRIILL